MTGLAMSPRLKLRPLTLLGVSLAVVVVSQLANVLGGAPTLPRPVAQTTTASEAGLPTVDGPSSETAEDLATIDHNIGAWTANLAANDADYISATNLGLLYDGRARLTGDVADYQRAIAALNRALAIEPTDISARTMHARELFATHDFAGALIEARAIDKDTPGLPQVLATIGDASLELGDYATARTIYDGLATLSPGAPVTARLARLAFLQGNVDDAASLADRAIDEAATDEDAGLATSWYPYLAGTIALGAGEPADALRDFDAALSLWPDSFLALAGRGRALAAAGQLDDAITAYQSAVAVSPQPDALAALGDLYALRGDTADANKQFDTVEFIGNLAAINAQVYNRALVLFWVNHGRNEAQALTLAQNELQTRKDIYGWDAYAWALLANGRAADADAAERNALALGTRDALLYYHAGVIAQAVGDASRARTMLERALALPGALDPLAATKAQAALESLR